MIEEYIDDIPKLPELENSTLAAEFTKKKGFEAISQM
jgi:hypothetical protein